jgi:hypothetical protein
MGHKKCRGKKKCPFFQRFSAVCGSNDAFAVLAVDSA